MADCNIRNIDPELLRDIKTLAAQKGLTLREWCIQVFQGETVGMHMTKEALDVLREKLPFIKVPPAMSYEESQFERPHNTKTCRVYRCAQCISLGKKF